MGIVIYNGDGNPVVELHGAAVNRNTLKLQSYATDTIQNTLRAFMKDADNLQRINSHAIPDKDLSEMGITPGTDKLEITIFEGDQQSVIIKMLQAMEAMQFINEQNLPYVVVDLIQSSQNSNSVARTLIEAMGLEYTSELENLFAPGDGRILLPEGWEPQVQLPDNFEDLTLEEKTTILLKLNDVVNGIAESLEPEHIKEQIKQDKPPTDNGDLYFNRNTAGRENIPHAQPETGLGAPTGSTR